MPKSMKLLVAVLSHAFLHPGVSGQTVVAPPLDDPQASKTSASPQAPEGQKDELSKALRGTSIDSPHGASKAHEKSSVDASAEKAPEHTPGDEDVLDDARHLREPLAEKKGLRQPPRKDDRERKRSDLLALAIVHTGVLGSSVKGLSMQELKDELNKEDFARKIADELESADTVSETKIAQGKQDLEYIKRLHGLFSRFYALDRAEAMQTDSGEGLKATDLGEGFYSVDPAEFTNIESGEGEYAPDRAEATQIDSGEGDSDEGDLDEGPGRAFYEPNMHHQRSRMSPTDALRLFQFAVWSSSVFFFLWQLMKCIKQHLTRVCVRSPLKLKSEPVSELY